MLSEGRVNRRWHSIYLSLVEFLGQQCLGAFSAMAIPDYQSLMLPVLKAASDGAEHRISNIIETIADQIGLTEAEREELLPSGKQPIVSNRIHWAKTYLVRAKLLEPTRRSFFRITDRGRLVLSENLPRIDNRVLRQFPEFEAFVAGGRIGPPKDTAVVEEEIVCESTPDELLRATVKEVEGALASELITRICAASPAFFERLVVDLLLTMGYGGSRAEAGRALGKTGDGGVDGVIDQDQLGLDRIYIQAKKFDPNNAVSEPEIRNFCGSLGANKANKGVFVTTSYFTKPAYDFGERHPLKVVLIDGDELARLMIRHCVGVRITETLHLKKIDDDFFPEG